MAKQQKEKFQTYVIPNNFVDKLRIAGGMLKLRNLVEAALMAGLLLFPILFFIPMKATGIIYVVVLVGVPVFAIGCIGLNGDSLFQFLGYWFSFKKNKRVSRYNPHIKKPENVREDLRQGDDDLLPRDKILKKLSELTGRSFEVEDQNYDELYEDVSMLASFNDDDKVLSYGFESNASLSKKDQQKQEKRNRQLAALGVKTMEELRFNNSKKVFEDEPQQASVDEIEEINRFIEEAKQAKAQRGIHLEGTENAEEATAEIPIFEIFNHKEDLP